MTDQEILDSFEYWFNHYKENGEQHYADTSEERFIELYFEKIIERMVENEDENDIDELVKRIETLCG